MTRICLSAVVIVYLGFACVGLGWGLPSATYDKHLFSTGASWSGKTLAEAVSGRRVDPHKGADVDVNPLAITRGGTVLNDTAQRQAEIYRRYRLYTRQPDEMITMMALSGMDPGARQFDPKLYQYGGLFLYPIGVIIRTCGTLGLMTDGGDLAYQLDHPDQFGRFYVASRLYAAAWGIPGILVVFAIGCRLGGKFAGITSALLFVLLPVVVCMSHEGKPHLPGAVLMLAAVWFTMRALDIQSWRAWAGLYVCCGAAVGMVLSSAPVMLLVPVAVGMHCRNQVLRERHELPSCSGRRTSYAPVFLRAMSGGWLVAAGVYVACNPYVGINLFANREVLASNFGNSAAMYEISRIPEGCRRVLELTVEGATWPVVLGGLVGVVAVIRRRRTDAVPLAVTAAVVGLQFVLIGAGKPDEYGRFGVFHESALAIACACVLSAIGRRNRTASAVLTVAICGWCLIHAGGYLWGFHADTRHKASHDLAAENLSGRLAAESVAIIAEPAPYSCPPIDFRRTPVVLYRNGPGDRRIDRVRAWNDALRSPRAGAPAAPRVLVAALDDPEGELSQINAPQWKSAEILESRTSFLPRGRISWANKPIVVLSR